MRLRIYLLFAFILALGSDSDSQDIHFGERRKPDVSMFEADLGIIQSRTDEKDPFLLLTPAVL
jgi:hypothetical protein